MWIKTISSLGPVVWHNGTVYNNNYYKDKYPSVSEIYINALGFPGYCKYSMYYEGPSVSFRAYPPGEELNIPDTNHNEYQLHSGKTFKNLVFPQEGVWKFIFLGKGHNVTQVETASFTLTRDFSSYSQ